MSLNIKICGMREPENIRQVADLKPDLLGFIFYQASPRYAEGKLNPENLRHLHPGIKKTGVFVNEEINRIKEVILNFHLDMVQLHGDESPEFCSHLYGEGIPVIKTIHLKDKIDFQLFDEYVSCTNFFLLDTLTYVYGGSGRKFDWKILSEYNLDHPFFLSGGISLHDVSEINSINHPFLYGVDLNSRFELEPGLKDVEMLGRFISGIRNKKKDL